MGYTALAIVIFFVFVAAFYLASPAIMDPSGWFKLPFEETGGGQKGFASCSDGTPHGHCSGYDYCFNGNFVDWGCDFCGCPEGQTCEKVDGRYECVE
jgi:hypothetical protein